MKSIRQGLVGVLMAGGLFTAMVNLPAMAADAAGWGLGKHGLGGPGEPGGPGQVFKKLGLSAEQQASIKAIMTASKPQMQSMHEQMRANHLKLLQIKPDDANYGNVVAQVAASNAALASQRTQQGAERRSQMYAVLTPAQKTQLTALEAPGGDSNPRKEHWHHGPHRAGPDGEGPGEGPGAALDGPPPLP